MLIFYFRLEKMWVLTFILQLLLSFSSICKIVQQSQVIGWPFSSSALQVIVQNQYIDALISFDNQTQIIERYNYLTREKSHTYSSGSINLNIKTYSDTISRSNILLNDQENLKIFLPNCQQIFVNTNVSNYCFGPTQDVVYYVKQGTTSYSIIQYIISMNNSRNIDQFFLPIIIKQIFFRNDHLFIITENGQTSVKYYPVSDILAFGPSITRTQSFTNIIKFQSNNDFFVFTTPSIQKSYKFSTTYPHINYSEDNVIDTCIIGDRFILILRSDNHLLQMDLQYGNPMDEIVLPPEIIEGKIFELSNHVLAVVSLGSSTIILFQILDITICPVSCGSCNIWQFLNGTQCLFYPYTQSYPPIIPFQSTNASTTTIPSFCSPIMPINPTLINDNSQPTNTDTLPQAPQTKQDPEEEWITEVSKFIGNSLSIAYFPSFLKAAIPLVLFLEDLELYQYHKGIQYTSFMQICMKEVNFMNTLRVDPEFIKFLDYQFIIFSSKELNQAYQINCESLHNYSLEDVDFFGLYSIRKLIFPSLVLKISIFCIFFLFQLIFGKIFNTPNSLSNDIAQGLKKRLMLWSLIPIILDPNLSKIIFHFFNQMTYFWSYSYISSISMVFYCVINSTLIIYSISFYVLIQKYYPVSSEYLLTFTKYCQNSFFLQAIFICLNKIIKSCIHSNVLTAHSDRLIILAAFNLLFMIGFTIWRRKFANMLIYLNFFLYEFVFMVFNLTMLLKDMGIQQLSEQMYSYTIFWQILLLIFLTILKMILVTYLELKDIIKYIIQKNTQVEQNPAPQSQELPEEKNNAKALQTTKKHDKIKRQKDIKTSNKTKKQKETPIYINLVFANEQKEEQTEKMETKKSGKSTKFLNIFDQKNYLRPEKKLKTNKSSKKHLSSKQERKN